MLITITGTNHYQGSGSLNINDAVELHKEPSNTHDKEAIAIRKNGLNLGHVANSVKTVVEGTYSAGRLYDKIGNVASAVVILKKGDLIVAEVVVKDTGKSVDKVDKF